MTGHGMTAEDGEPLFDSPEQAALADWTGIPSARARVVAVEATSDPRVVQVRVQLDGTPGFHDVDVITCQQEPGGLWRAGGSTGSNS